MRKKLTIFVILPFLIVLSAVFIFPSSLIAAPVEFNGHYYELFEMTGKTWQEAKDLAEQQTYMGYKGHLVTITSQSEQDFIKSNILNTSLPPLGNTYYIGAYQEAGATEPAGGWNWVTGETWQYENWNTGEPNDNQPDEDYGEIYNYGTWNDTPGITRTLSGFIVEYDEKIPTTATPAPEPWVRGDRDMVCYQVWVNDDNCFELVFWWEYEMNNWVKIYDMEGNMVYEVDMPYGDAHIEVCLPDGMYTVKTFHDQPEPLQEFVIGKGTGAEDAIDQEKPVAVAPSLTGTVWEWEKFESSDDSVVTVDDPTKYTLLLNTDGTVNIKADCNVAVGSYTMQDSSLRFSPIATTLAYCGEDSMDTQFLSYLENVATYVISGGKLYLNLWADAGNMVFRNGG